MASALTVGGTSALTTDVDNKTITLSNGSNALTGAVTVTTQGTIASHATLNNSLATTLTSTVAGDLTVMSML